MEWHSLALSGQERAFLEYMEQGYRDIFSVFALPAPLLTEISRLSTTLPTTKTRHHKRKRKVRDANQPC